MEVSTRNGDKSTCLILGLPVEVRLRIYEYVFRGIMLNTEIREEPANDGTSQGNQEVVERKWKFDLCRRYFGKQSALGTPDRTAMAILTANRTIYAETLPVMYSNLYVMLPAMESAIRELSRFVLSNVRHVSLLINQFNTLDTDFSGMPKLENLYLNYGSLLQPLFVRQLPERISCLTWQDKNGKTGGFGNQAEWIERLRQDKGRKFQIYIWYHDHERYKMFAIDVCTGEEEDLQNYFDRNSDVWRYD